jgi:glycosyltransferase involved in cell wall biosynthesis
MSPPLLTIITPTWNRKHLLPRLHDSLLSQDAPEGSFEWLVVDDGSTDGTAEYIRSLVGGSPFRLRFIQQANGGKHRALNRGVQEIVSPWVLVVDSDDWIVPKGISLAIEEIREAETDRYICAIIAPCDFGPGIKVICPLANAPVSYAEMHNNNRIVDSSIIIRASSLRSFPFPEIEGEKFISESSFYARAFREKVIRLSETRIIRAQYQEGGLSALSVSIRCANPLGCLYTYRMQTEAGTRRVRSLLNYHRFYWHAVWRGRAPGRNGFHPSLLWSMFGAGLFLKDQWQLLWNR